MHHQYFTDRGLCFPYLLYNNKLYNIYTDLCVCYTTSATEVGVKMASLTLLAGEAGPCWPQLSSALLVPAKAKGQASS